MFLCNVGTNAGAPDLYAAGGYFGEKWQEPDGLYYHGLHGDRLRDMYREVGEALCESPDGTVKGDNFESTGPLDPTFFLIHPTMDRLFQVRGSGGDRRKDASSKQYRKHQVTGLGESAYCLSLVVWSSISNGCDEMNE